MAKVKCDTERIKDVGQKLIKEAAELNILFGELYNKIYSIQKDKIWIGYASNKFLEKKANEKNEMYAFCSDLKKYGQQLVNASVKYDNLIRKYRK